MVQIINPHSGLRPYVTHTAWGIWVFLWMILIWWRVPLLVTDGTKGAIYYRFGDEERAGLSRFHNEAVRRALRLLSKPSRCRFLVKNSETEISRCFFAMRSAALAELRFLAAMGLSLVVAVPSSSGNSVGCSSLFRLMVNSRP